jgi:hypothetical protein
MTIDKLLLASIALLSACAAGPQRGFTDATGQDRDALQRHLEQRAAGLSTSGERLTVEIVDLDRAGSFEARTPALSAVRIVRDVYPARIVLKTKGGPQTLSGLPVAGAARYGEDPLRYEKALLDDWLERELSAARRSDR